MASTFTPLGVELMATGENAGTWGTKTNTNLNLIEQLTGGYSAKSIAGGVQTTALTITDGNTTGTGQFRMIDFAEYPPVSCSIRFKFALVFVPHVPAFSPVAINSTPRGVYVEAIV